MTEFDQFLPQGQQLRCWPFIRDNGRGWVRVHLGRKILRTGAGCAGIEEFDSTTVTPAYAVVGERDVLKANAGGIVCFT